MSTSALTSSENLENVPLVRMEDVQPVLKRNSRVYKSRKEDDEQELETCIVDDDIDYETECIINSEDVVYCDDSSSSGELIVPEVVKPPQNEASVEIKETKRKPSDSWPTLEILPGGVIQHSDKFNDQCDMIESETVDDGKMMYACAKCSEGFKQLFSLVKHVKWHEEEGKKQQQKDVQFSKLKRSNNKHTLHLNKKKNGNCNRKIFVVKSTV